MRKQSTNEQTQLFTSFDPSVFRLITGQGLTDLGPSGTTSVHYAREMHGDVLKIWVNGANREMRRQKTGDRETETLHSSLNGCSNRRGL